MFTDKTKVKGIRFVSWEDNKELEIKYLLKFAKCDRGRKPIEDCSKLLESSGFVFNNYSPTLGMMTYKNTDLKLVAILVYVNLP